MLVKLNESDAPRVLSYMILPNSLRTKLDSGMQHAPGMGWAHAIWVQIDNSRIRTRFHGMFSDDLMFDPETNLLMHFLENDSYASRDENPV